MFYYAEISYKTADGDIALLFISNKLIPGDTVSDSLTGVLTDYVKKNIVSIQVRYSRTMIQNWH